MTGRADYDQIAQVYDQVRVSDAPHLEWWRRRIIEAGELGPGKRLIDLGCGTGRWTIPLAAQSGCEALGLDRSAGMLEKARAKDAERRVTWVQGDVEHLDVEPGSFDCAFMCLMMHHLTDHLATFRGVYRALRPGGVFLIRQGTLEDTAQDPMHRFFPEALTIDRGRIPLLPEIVFWLEEAGFAPVEHGTMTQTTYVTLDRMVAEFDERVMSALHLISDEAYHRGLRRLKDYIAAHPHDPWLYQSRFTLFAARKGPGAGGQGPATAVERGA
jgi:SAM-dependent methyltransferase